MRFKIDENLPVDAAKVIRQYNFDVHTVHDEHMSGAVDDDIYQVCIHEKRILITLDLDFSDIRAYTPKESSGIIVIRTKKHDRHTLISILTRLFEVLTADGISQKLWIVEENRIRIRE